MHKLSLSKLLILSLTYAIVAISAYIPASAQNSHDITSLSKWGPYSKEYFGISHIADLQSGIQVEFMMIPGQYRRNFKIPNALFEAGVHPWHVTADMKIFQFNHYCNLSSFCFFTRFTECFSFPIRKFISREDSVSEVSKSGITISVSTSPNCFIIVV